MFYLTANLQKMEEFMHFKKILSASILASALIFCIPQAIYAAPDAKTETADVIHDRLERAAQEAQEMGSYEYIIVNDDLDTCVKQVHELIQSAHCKKSHNTAFIKELQQDMNCFLKGE